jgi:cell wall-associated NlpC family hydrolase
VTPGEAVSRAEVASMFQRGYGAASSWLLYGMADFAVITFPELSPRQKEITSFALKYVGYPYVWGGEYPTENSPYGHQKSGGFDCSGFAFYVMKMKFGYPITVNERGGGAMAKVADPRITRKKLTGCDVIFFGTKGPKSSISDIYHVGLYLGNGWFIHSTGSSDGVTLASLDSSSYWKQYFAWGRRLLSDEELAIPDTAVD